MTNQIIDHLGVGDGERQDGEITQGHGETGGGRYVHYLNSGDGFMRVPIHQNLPSCTFLYVQLIIGHLNKALKRTHC